MVINPLERDPQLIQPFGPQQGKPAFPWGHGVVRTRITRKRFEAAELPSVVRVMDLQQEQLARSLSDGHRVIDGVAGSGETLILACRAQHVARTFMPPPATSTSGAASNWSPSAQMVDSANNSLLLLDDDALSLYGRRRPAGDLAACDLTAANRSQPWRIGPIRKPFARADFNSLCWSLTAGSRTSSDRCVLRDPRSSRWHVRAIAAPIRDHRRQSPLEPR